MIAWLVHNVETLSLKDFKSHPRFTQSNMYTGWNIVRVGTSVVRPCWPHSYFSVDSLAPGVINLYIKTVNAVKQTPSVIDCRLYSAGGYPSLSGWVIVVRKENSPPPPESRFEPDYGLFDHSLVHSCGGPHRCNGSRSN